jgi:hypothetical protein
MSWDRDLDDSFGGSGNQALSSPDRRRWRFALFSSIAPTGDLTLVLREVI